MLDRRTLLLGAGALGLGATATASWLSSSGPGTATAPHPNPLPGRGEGVTPRFPTTAQGVDTFDDLRRRLRTFRTVVADIPYGEREFYLAASRQTGRVALFLGPSYGWFLWREDRLTRVGLAEGDNPCPTTLEYPVLPQLADLWSEVTSGFAGSIVTRDRPEALGSRFRMTGVSPDLEIRMIQLPFPWAARLRLFIQYGALGRIHELTLLRDDGSDVPTAWPFGRRRAQFRSMGWRWNVPVPAGVFTTAYPRIPPIGRSTDLLGRRSGPATRDDEHCEVEQGHHHGDELEGEHTWEEIEGCGTPQSETIWDPSCEPPDPNDPCQHPPSPPPHPPTERIGRAAG